MHRRRGYRSPRVGRGLRDPELAAEPDAMSDITPEDHPVLDWRKSLDSRNGNYLLRSVLPPEGIAAKQVLWRRPYRHLDQGRVGACTMFATTIARMHVGPAGQRTWRPTPNTDEAGNAFALKWFHRAQELDEFASTPPEDGSSVNGAAKAGKEAGIYKAHYWAESVDDIKASLRVHGSGVFGSSWPSGSFHYDDTSWCRTPVAAQAVTPVASTVTSPTTTGAPCSAG
jgi:hypothetical protein